MPDEPKRPSGKTAAIPWGQTPPPLTPVPPDAPRKDWSRTVAADPGYSPVAAAAPKHGYLTMMAGGPVGAMVRIGDGETILGRNPESSIYVDGDGVSWRHARIFKAGDSYLLEDLKSTNGTGVNDKRVDFHKLVEGDRIHLGPGIILRFNLYDDLEAGVQQQLYESAVRDPLTRAYNRKHFAERLKAEVAYATRHRTPLSMVMFDIDFFKKVNDTYGHPAGDAVLKSVSAAIHGVVRAEDLFARVGGEEFAILARQTDGAHAKMFAERLRSGIQGMWIAWQTPTGNIPVTASFGVASLDELPQADGDALIARVDARLYEAKQGGRNRVVGPP